MNAEEFRRNVDQNVICHYSIDTKSITNFAQLQLLVKAEKCVSYTVPSAVLLGRCVPGSLVEASSIGNTSLNNFIQQFGNPSNLVPSDEILMQSRG